MKYDVIIVGGGPAGMISALTARKYYPEKKILLLKQYKTGVIPCGIPYIFTTLEQPDDNCMGTQSLEANSIELKVDEVTGIDRDAKEIKTKNGETLGYEKLILAVGSNPIKPPIEGIEKEGVYTVIKEMEYLKKLKEAVSHAKEIIIIGGGFIGVEFADELSKLEGANVTLVEFLPEILANSFDSEFSMLAKGALEKNGVRVISGEKVVKINGNDKVESVQLSSGAQIPCQVIILGIGTSPNTELAANAGLEIGKSRGILVDEYLRTSTDSNIFAVGDCAEKRDFFTRKRIPVMLASTATAEARIAGASLFGLKVVRENRGTIATYSTRLGDVALGSAGLTEKTAKQEGFEIIVGRAEGVDRHPGKIPDAHKIKFKLIFSKQSGILLGGQVAGGESIGEIVNIIGLALQKNVSMTELETMQLATHPKLTAAPTTYPLIVAAQDAIGKMK